MKDLVSSHVHSSWAPILEPLENEISEILKRVESDQLAPSRESIFKAFEGDLESIRCVIIGQDPYPAPGMAMGLSFSIPRTHAQFPPTLKNIFKELSSDLGISTPEHGDLSKWSKNGVMLLNRVLTTRVSESNAHRGLGWEKITTRVAEELGKRDVIAILWGAQAQELAHFFTYRVVGVHPSPLSAYRGFFGSKPFSRVNEFLLSTHREPIDWSL
ncbi:MAG: hypothetical protein RLZ23_398 [Actinomycetota bacterium]